MANNYQGIQFPQGNINQQPMPQMAQQAQVPQYQNFSLFPQPIGSVYNLSAATDINNIPVGQNVSVGLCLNEGLIYIKSLQNGAPVTLAYRLNSLDGAGATDSTEATIENEKIMDILEDFKAHFHKIDNQLLRLQDKGGKSEWQL